VKYRGFESDLNLRMLRFQRIEKGLWIWIGAATPISPVSSRSYQG
jgi:hypothetical protein